ncbi:MAG: ABC transporter ATP-binding protein, partial [Solirubrobacteraceae bacterium]
GGDPLASVPHVSLRRRLGLLRYLRPHLVGVGVLLATVVLVSLLALAVPWPIKIVVDNVLGTVPPGPLLEALPGPDTPEALLVAAVAMAVLIFIATTAVELVQSYLNVRVGQRVTYALAADVFAHVQRLSLVFHGRRPVGDTIARVNQDTFGLQSMLVGVGVPIAQSLVTLVAMFTIMYVLSPELTLLALAVVPLQLLAIAVFAQPMKRASRDRLDREGRLVSVVQQTLTSLPAVQAFTRERVEHARFVRDADHTLAAYMRETLAGMWFKLVVGAATAAGTAAIMYLGAKQALDGDLSTGTIIVFLAYLAALYAPLDSIAYTASSFQSAAAQCDRVIEILDSRPDVEDAPHADEAPIAAGHVRYEGVSFGYDPTRLALQDIDVEARPGEVIAIVGPTGAGKTTLVSLLVRFFDPQRGRITIDGRDVHAWKARALREQIGLVLQEPFILPLTAAENIAYGRPDASREDIVEAARAADAHDFIERLPQGYDTVIGERGATLSGGEKQRLSIARAFLKDARILILDEPTSALDARTEAALLDALQRLSAGRTSFVIAHRLSTIRGADRILVVDGGRIADQGSHGELVARGGLYAELYAQQMDFTRHDVAPGALLSAPAPAQRFHRDPVEG